MKKTLLSLTAFLLLFFCTLPIIQAHAQESEAEGPKVKATLISEFSTIEPGEPFWIALHQDIIPGWHTYWENPGDSGLKTNVRWVLPPGFKAEPILWPTPSLEPMGPVINYGYSNEVTLMAKITPTMDLKPGQTIRIAADATWLACHDICIPEQATNLPLTLKVADSIPEPSQHYQKFADTRAKIPPVVSLNPERSTIEWPEKDRIRLTLSFDDNVPLPDAAQTTDIYFFPRTWGFLQHTLTQDFTFVDAHTITIETNTTNGLVETLPSLSGVVTFQAGGERIAYDITLNNPRFSNSTNTEETTATEKPEVTPDATIAPTVEQHAPSAPNEPALTLWGAILFAFLGGLALNLMPCVFPILSMKALSLVQKSHKADRFEVFMGGLSYTLGILVSFAILGSVLIILQSGGTAVGWGGQLQNPAFVLLMVYVLFIIGLMLSGVLTVGASLMGIGQNLTTKQGHTGDFFTGALATLVATPCTAPFMGAAIFYALTQPWHISLIVLEVLGLGLALPYLLLAAFPTLLRFLPKPGVWMERFKQFLAFPMFGAAIWLVWVLSRASGDTGVVLALTGCLAIAFGAWLWQHRDTHDKKGLWRTVKTVIALVAIAFSIYLLNIIEEKITPVVCKQDTAFMADSGTLAPTGEPVAFSTELLDKLVAQDKPVLVNMTAAWCITCLANDKVALSTDAVKQALVDYNITYLKGDWTNRDQEITRYLDSFGRKGVPIYVFYPKGVNNGSAEPVVLPQLLTPSIVINAIKN